MRKLICLLSFFTTTAISSIAQRTVELLISLRDGNSISGTSNMSNLNLQTKYGQLNIPLEDVTSIKIGSGLSNSINQNAARLLQQLKKAESNEKEKIFSELVNIGTDAIGAINKFLSDPNNVSEADEYNEFSVENVLAKIKSNNNIDNGTPDQDEISLIENFNIGGVYDFAKIDIKTNYGNLSIPKNKIKSIELSVVDTSKNASVFKLQASKNITANTNGGWLKTGITLKQGQKFNISASGQIILASLSNQKYKPDGSYIDAYGASQQAYKSSSYDNYDYGNSSYPSYGQVVYKIGNQSEKPLMAGSKFNGVANTSGELYISIYESVYNSSNSGSYYVKINIEK